MRARKVLPLLFVAMLAFGLMAFTMPPQVQGPDWSAVSMTIVNAVMPILLPALTAWVLVMLASAWKDLQAKRPDIVAIIQDAARWAVPVVEQLKKSGFIPSNEAALKKATELVESYLRIYNIDIDLDPYAELIYHSIEKAVAEWNQANTAALAGKA